MNNVIAFAPRKAPVDRRRAAAHYHTEAEKVRRLQHYQFEPSEAIAMVAMNLYAHCTLSQLSQAIKCGRFVLERDGNFLKAMEAAERVLDILSNIRGMEMERAKDQRAVYCAKLDNPKINRRYLRAIAELRINNWMAGHATEDRQSAVLSAKRYIDQGVTFSRSIYQAMAPFIDR
jgi:hypothetical protein